ncbi:ATP-binding protein [Candidatus Palauibacter sp.]|uniref:hybrid sensor histidine kinase/response regulator n=1 Tax=Candidatus Palauibacter sp. TaxID=3101350 RepID=UPI003AF2C596
MTTDTDALLRRVEVLRARIARLCGALLRISASLDLDTVLREVVDGARALTGARRGVITMVDELGRAQRFLSSGIPPDEHRQLANWADGQRLFEHLRDLPRPLRVADLPGYVRSLGLSAPVLPGKTLQGTPIRHRGVHLGSLFLTEKEGGREFTSEDEEMLVLFASQAGAAIGNARAYRDERRARANMEALVETSPVGVVVFDAGSGDALSVNREAARIVEGLRMPDQSLEQLLEVITCRRADGREVALADFTLALRLSTAETLRTEEIVLSVPDGRSVKTLVNATPIHAPEGGVESVVVTMQDLAPFEELERMRAEFLAIVSHELRTPLTSIKGSAATVLAASPGFAPAEMLQFLRIIDTQADHMSGLIGDLLDAGRIATGTLSVAPEPSEAVALVDRARNTFLSGGGRHTVLVDLPSDLPRVMVDRQRCVQVLNNLFSNAARHAPESSPIRVTAERDGVYVAISVSDRGGGIPPEQLAHLFQKYAGAGAGERGLGAGLGLAICKGLVEAHGGRIWATSGGEGRGARFTFTVPVADEAGGDPVAPASARGRAVARRQGREPARILVVDDDPQALLHVRDALTEAGYAALVTGDHHDLDRVIRAEKPHLVLLDLMLSGTDGIQLMEHVPELADLPVIFISAYGRDETIARALEAGAADYIVKPFSPTELTARIRSALRRHTQLEPFVLGELAIDYERRRVTLADRPVALTATEYEVLRVLSANAGRVSTHRSLLRQAWGRAEGHGDPKLVHAVVKRLRRKLGEDAARAAYILNERGVGYRMPAPREE